MATTHLVDANEIFILGGAQAIAGMAVGTESIRKVDSIAEIGVDLFAGPTEVPATHLLSQAEHGPDSPAVLITTSEDSAKQVMTLIDRFLETLSTAAIASTAWRSFREVVIVDSIDEAYALGDEYAFDHVQILT
ncbi:histidinol dehydrogenase [Blastomyces dermatitidis ATCC 18188]|uniref:Histidinol dehydrogenase n=1 Tax=Ajellomyces dermatitidis (strain ATCC 18188 / CBS 674.68) TaxID=653446 RepID=F2TFS0_AJEDA|nr:histidinol dehydrogenase [Blastomyces dermatitidis ATCC 18188]